MTEEQKYWQIHDFLKGRLRGNDLESFQKKVEQDVSLQEEVAKHKLANQLIIENRLQLAHQVSLQTQIQYKKSLLYKKVGVGCGIALLAGIFLFLGLQATKNTSLDEVNIPSKISTKKPEIQSVKKIEIPVQKEVTATARKNNETVKPTSSRSAENVFQPMEAPQKVEKEVVPEKAKATEAPILSPGGAEEKPILPALPKKEEVAKVEKTCADVRIKANISVTNACHDSNNGTITLSRFQGGVAPYHYEIQSQAHPQVFSHSELPLGTYVVLITDARHCTSRIDNVVIKGVICEEVERAFNPFLDETLELPAYSSGGTLIVHEKNGNVFYKKEIVQGEKVEWNGMSSQGQLESGHFSYEIQYHDGTKKQGTITITR